MLALIACAAAPTDSAEACPCDAIAVGEPVGDEPGLLALLESARDAGFPGETPLSVREVRDLQFFSAAVDLNTLGGERSYIVSYDPLVLTDPPEPAALAAVLVHELGHVDDYATMSDTELIDFGLWYAGEEPATSEGLRDYERATDEKALARGCGPGLAAMRDWIYAHCSGEVLAEKQRNYFSPEEIDAWMAANGRCPG